MILVPKPGVLDVESYVGGGSGAPGVERVIKLSSNETPFGPSPNAFAAAQDAAAEAGIYPEGNAWALREALAAFHSLDSERIVCGNGSNELLTLIANCYLRPKDEVVMSAHGFLLYKIATLANSAVPIEIPEDDLKWTSMPCSHASPGKPGSSMSPIPIIRPEPTSPPMS